MAISVGALARSALARAGVVLLAIALSGSSAAQRAPVAEGPSIAGGASTITSHGVTLRSVAVEIPASSTVFPGGRRADIINRDCLLCHSAEMVLSQPKLSRAAWQSEVEKMRDSYKAPSAAEDIPPIVDYLATMTDPTR